MRNLHLQFVPLFSLACFALSGCSKKSAPRAIAKCEAVKT